MAAASSAVESAIDRLANLQLNGLATSSAPNLQKNLPILSPHQMELGKMLVEMGQGHLFENWPDPGVEDAEKISFLDQVDRLNENYPGGLASYIETAKELLADSKAGKNPFDGFTPSVPSGEILTFGDDNFVQYEEAGIKQARTAAFVLVAGGLGERLGYNGIKVALPRESTTETCFLQHYIDSILALEEVSNIKAQGECRREIPFVIMTSDDTHSRTLALLESNAYFGMKPTQVKLLKQEKVACLDDNDAKLAVDPHNKYKIQTKPHGHGDVHSLLYSSGLLKEWQDAGLKWVLFFQDTNGLLFKAIPSALGVSAIKQYHVNSLAVPRKAKEAIGGITKLTHADEECFTKNDITFANRPKSLAGKHLGGNYTTLTWLSYGSHRRNLRKIASLSIFSTSRIQMFESIRSKEIQLLIRYLFRGSLDGQFQTMDMKSAFSELQLSIIMLIITGKRFYGDNMVELEETRKFRYIVTETFKLSGTTNIGDFVPALNWFGPTWTEKKLKVLRETRDKSLQQLIDERRRMRGDSCFEEGNKTLVDVLLSLQESEPECYTDETISGLMQVMIIAGTDTSSGTMEWALSLLLDNPAALEKACDEINRQIGHSRLMEDSDLSKLPYLHSIINETLRMCPAAAISPPHESSEDCTVGGFHVPRGTMLLVNLWAIQNYLKWWDEPTTFKP